MGSLRHPWTIVLLLLIFVGVLLLNASYYYPFLSDDSLISLRYVDRLLDGFGLTWTDGHPVEGYSNLLWILLITFLGLFGVDLIFASRILGVLGMALIMYSLLFYYVRKDSFRATWFPLTTALLFLSIAGPIAVWAIGGLEQPLYGGLIALSIVLTYRIIDLGKINSKNIFYLSLTLGLVCITRPDGPLFAVASAFSLFIIGLFYKKKQLLVRSFYVLVGAFAFYGGQTVFRFFYYGEFVPNTALVKITPSIQHFLHGLEYLKDGFVSLSPFSIVALIFIPVIFFSTEKRAKGIYLSVVLFLWSAYVVFIGGDVFPAYRHFIPLIVVFSFLLVEGFLILTNYLKQLPSPKYYFAVIAFSFFLFIPYTLIQLVNDQSRRAVNERFEWQGRDVALLLKDAFSTQQPLLAVTAAGCLPYWSELPAVDMLGLNDYYLPRNPPKDVGDGKLGHELGDGRYVLSREPDIIVFNVGSEPAYRSGLEMRDMPDFHRFYIPVMTRASQNHRALIYFNKYSHKIGIQKTQSSIVVPGFLFKGKDTIVYLNKTNKLVAPVRSEQPVSFTFDHDSQHNWKVEIISPDSEKIESTLKQDVGSLSITLSSESSDPLEIEEVILSKEVVLSKRD